jgi:hypothetical protein
MFLVHAPFHVSLSSYCCSVWSPLRIAVACGVKLVLAKSFPVSFLVWLCSRFKECAPAACRPGSVYSCFYRSIPVSFLVWLCSRFKECAPAACRQDAVPHRIWPARQFGSLFSACSIFYQCSSAGLCSVCFLCRRGEVYDLCLALLCELLQDLVSVILLSYRIKKFKVF